MRTSSATSEWSSRELLQPAVADEVGARVADVADRDVLVADERDGHRRAHPGHGRVLARARRRRGGSPPGSARRRAPRRRAVAAGPRASAAAASREATSPACAPPIPSATAKSGGSQTYESSFRRRLRPGSVTAAALRPTLIARTSARSRRP